MRAGIILLKNIIAGILIEENDSSYIFQYSDLYLANPELPPISLTMPKTIKEYRSPYLFPIFFNMLSEGINKVIQCKRLHIDEDDYFGLFLATCQNDTIGAITVQPLFDSK